jgi:hypothetical protein
MSQENQLNMLDKYFKPKRITQIIGDNNSIKENFISIYLAHKAINNLSKIIFIYSKGTINIRFIFEACKHLNRKDISDEKLEKMFLFFEFMKFDSMGEFILNILPLLIEKEQNISTIVINNLNNFFSTTSYKFLHDHRHLGIDLLNLARKYNLNIIYLNDYFYYCETKFLNNRNNINYIEANNNANNPNYKKSSQELDNEINNKEGSNNEEEEDNNEIEEYYNKEPINYDILAEFCSHTLFAETRKPRIQYGSFAEEDYIIQGNFRVI